MVTGILGGGQDLKECHPDVVHWQELRSEMKLSLQECDGMSGVSENTGNKMVIFQKHLEKIRLFLTV